MKENSIKETIKIIERKIKEAEHYSDITGLYLTLDEELCNAFINILSDYKRVQEEFKQVDHECERLEEKEVKLIKENEKLKDTNTYLQKENDELKKQRKIEPILINNKMYFIDNEIYNELLEDIKSNYTSVQKVKDKIEELKQEKGKYGNCLMEMYEDELVNKNIKILQELLESEE